MPGTMSGNESLDTPRSRPPQAFPVPSAVYGNLEFSSVSDPEKKETLARSDPTGPPENIRNHNDDSTPPTAIGRRARDTIGIFGLAVLIGGTALLLAAMAMLIFLWAPAWGDEQVAETSSFWRWLVLNDSRPLAVLQTITVLTAVARLVTAAQTTLTTSLFAAVVLESNAGVPLFRVPEFSVMRSATNGPGPLRLTWLLLKSWAAHIKPLDGPFACLALLMLGLSVAVQFSSTILISDLGSMRVSGYPSQRQVPVLMSQVAFQPAQTARSWLESGPTARVPFGEVAASGSDMRPSASGVSDTGILRRVFLPLQQQDEASLRRYVGKGYTLDSRYVCMPPTLNATISVAPVASTPSLDAMPFFARISGSINYGTTFGNAGLGFDPSCSGGSCFPTTFDCTMPSLISQQAGGISSGSPYGGQAYSVCMLSSASSSGLSTAQNTALDNSTSSISADAKVFLLSRNNGNWLNWSFQNASVTGQPRQGLNGTIQVPSADASSSKDGEWTRLQLVNGVTAEYSLCFQELSIGLSDVEVSSDGVVDASLPPTSGNQQFGMIDTSAARNMLGAMPNSTTVGSRGIFTVNSVVNTRDGGDNTTEYLVNKLLLKDLAASGQSVSMIMNPMATSYSSLEPDAEYQSLFADILSTTGRPVMGLQSIMTAAMGSMVNRAVSSGQMDVTEDATVTSSTEILAPERIIGLVVVVCLLSLHLLCVVGITTQFLTQTQYSGRGKGNHWQTIAQVVSVGTKRTIEGARERTDKDISTMLANGDTRVRIARCPYTGRVTVVPLDVDCLKEWRAQFEASVKSRQQALGS